MFRIISNSALRWLFPWVSKHRVTAGQECRKRTEYRGVSTNAAGFSRTPNNRNKRRIPTITSHFMYYHQRSRAQGKLRTAQEKQVFTEPVVVVVAVVEAVVVAVVIVVVVAVVIIIVVVVVAVVIIVVEVVVAVVAAVVVVVVVAVVVVVVVVVVVATTAAAVIVIVVAVG
ncbi:hypothetical protein ElyMa_000411200 [Elysia marginata]|uniref:ABC transmembrane type-1 domain-containing protein n=1 Tax=Elysia marginata TaxID=1093978 RepID=A0AAV4FJS8_9GAST|nr:hypothetical protein ElyMa_000411200 [Elysia marginata]